MNKKLLIGALVIVAIGAAVYLVTHRTPDTTEEPSASATPEKSKGFNNKYMSLDVAAGWKATAVGTEGAVNITKGNWVLYINPAAAQASGVEGGRFDEYAAGAPGVELVMGKLERPRSGRECNEAIAKPGAIVIEGTSVARFDYFTVMKGALPGCTLPQEAPAAWFFAVIGNKNGLNEVKSVTDKKVVPAPNDFPMRLFAITMSYKAATVDDLPRRYTSDLDMGLREMDSMVSTLVFN